MLLSWAKDDGFLFREITQRSVDSIRRNSENTMFGQAMQWDKIKVDPSKLWLPELEQLYKDFDQQDGVDTPNLKVALILYIASRADIKETTRLTFLSNVMRNDKSLKAVAFAGDSFAKLAKIDFRPLATKEMLDWWENNKDSLP